jgi:hypothetical protein
MTDLDRVMELLARYKAALADAQCEWGDYETYAAARNDLLTAICSPAFAAMREKAAKWDALQAVMPADGQWFRVQEAGGIAYFNGVELTPIDAARGK